MLNDPSISNFVLSAKIALARRPWLILVGVLLVLVFWSTYIVRVAEARAHAFSPPRPPRARRAIPHTARLGFTPSRPPQRHPLRTRSRVESPPLPQLLTSGSPQATTKTFIPPPSPSALQPPASAVTLG